MAGRVRKRVQREVCTPVQMPIGQHPISNVTWRPVESLSANDYNPNYVQKAEMVLLETSLLASGWIQPILCTKEGVIIDGFHRATLARSSEAVRAMTGGKVPVVEMDLTEPERMMLTIRINRAKGSHAAFKMADIVKALVNDYGVPLADIKQGIGADQKEMEVLMMDSVFQKLDIENHEYSAAWFPAKTAAKAREEEIEKQKA